MKSIVARLIVVLAFLTSAYAVADSSPRVVVSIKPFHSLASSIMEGAGTPYLVVKGFQSPHTYQLLPSDAQAFIEADLVYWVGPALESNLGNFLSNLSEETTVVEIPELDGLTLISNLGDGHDESVADEDHSDEEEHAHAHEDEAHDDHGHEEDEHHDDDDKHAKMETEEQQHDDHHDEDGHHGHDHSAGGIDVHLWLDVGNAKVVASEMARMLASADPQNQEVYLNNEKRLIERLNALEKELAVMAESVHDKPYIVFHDAYRYIQARYGLHYVEAVTISPEQSPSAKRFRELVNYAKREDIHCVFKEPQFSSKTVEVLATEKNLSVVNLDPLGADLDPGPDAYFDLMRNIMVSLQDCLLETAS